MTIFFCIAGRSGSGKTVLVETLIPILRSRGIAVGVVKHTHHLVDTDKKGSDTWRHSQAGAGTVVLAGPETTTIFRQGPVASPDELAFLFPDQDIVITEGFKNSRINKIEVIRKAVSTTPVCAEDGFLRAYVTDHDTLVTSLPVFTMTDYEAIASFIITQCL